MTLDQAKPGKIYTIGSITGNAEDSRHLYTLGFAPGQTVTWRLCAPSGDPVAFMVGGAVIALRKRQLATIEVHQHE